MRTIFESSRRGAVQPKGAGYARSIAAYSDEEQKNVPFAILHVEAFVVLCEFCAVKLNGKLKYTIVS